MAKSHSRSEPSLLDSSTALLAKYQIRIGQHPPTGAVGSQRAFSGLTALSVPVLDSPESGGGWLLEQWDPAGGAARLQQGLGGGGTGLGGAVEGIASGEGNRRTPAHAHPAHKSASPRSRKPAPYSGWLGPPLRSPRPLPDPHPFERNLQPHRPSRQEEGPWALAPARLGLEARWAAQAATSPSWGRVSSHSPNPGGELGEGAGQGRKRAGAVFVAALPSGTDGWGRERVRGRRRRDAGAGG